MYINSHLYKSLPNDCLQISPNSVEFNALCINSINKRHPAFFANIDHVSRGVVHEWYSPCTPNFGVIYHPCTCHFYRVATHQGKIRENQNFLQVRESWKMSGNFSHLTRVSEFSGNFVMTFFLD